jgi:hypothetical protein
MHDTDDNFKMKLRINCCSLEVATVLYMRHTENHVYVPFVVHSHNTILLTSFMIYHRILKKSNTTGTNSGAKMSTLLEEPEFISGVLWNSCYFSFLCSVLLIIICLFVLFLVTIMFAPGQDSL